MEWLIGLAIVVVIGAFVISIIKIVYVYQTAKIFQSYM